MKWLIRRSGYYWPTMLEDCFKYDKGCQACQRFGKIQMVPASVMNPIINPWPFRGWAMDMIGQINPSSSKGHQWVLAATDYFTKWVEAVPMRSVASRDVISFVKEHIIHRPSRPMEDRSLYQRSSESLLMTWGLNWSDHLRIMPKLMDRLKHPTRALSSS